MALAASLGCAGAPRAPLPARGAALPAPAQSAEAAPEPYGLAELAHLLVLPGRSVDVTYPPGALDRAAHVQQRAEAIVETLREIARRPVGLRLWVLDREEWERVGFSRPYGLPARVEPGAFVLPASGDPALVATLAGLAGGALRPTETLPLRGTPEEAAALAAADLLFQVDAARDLARQAGLRGEEPWIGALLAHVAARVVFERHEPGRMPEVAALYDAVAERLGGLASRRLADYREGLMFEADLWYQAQLLRGADVVWVEEGARGSSRFLYRLIEKDVPLAAAELDRRYPGLAAWRAESFAR